MSLIRNSDRNKIGDRGCRHISWGGWLGMKGVGMRINQNISAVCSVREEGCRAMTKWKGRLEYISCILVVTKINKIKSEWPAPAS